MRQVRTDQEQVTRPEVANMVTNIAGALRIPDEMDLAFSVRIPDAAR